MTVIAYHFTGDRLRDGRPIPAIGEKLVHEGEIVWCESGLYAALKPHQALIYAPGALLHLVHCDRIEREDGDKFVCRERTIIKTIDATYLLRRFAADQALSVAHLWDMPEVVREYLTTLDETKRASAAAAAAAAAPAAAPDAASAATWDAVWGAASAATWDAARAAPEDEAWGATRADFDVRVYSAMEAAA